MRVPPALDEAVRDVCRARTDASDDLSRAKQRLNSFLLRNGIRYSGKARWTPAHLRYLRHLTLPDPVQNLVLEEYLQAIDSGYERVERLADRMKELLVGWEWEPVVRALMTCKGFQEVAAMTLISELGDLRRFDHPRKPMAFLGLAPGEYTSGDKRRQNSITKCGNSHARWMLVECSQHYRKAPKVSAALSRRQEGQSKEVKALSWRMQHRFVQPESGPSNETGRSEMAPTGPRQSAAPAGTHLRNPFSYEICPVLRHSPIGNFSGKKLFFPFPLRQVRASFRSGPESGPVTL